MLGRKAGPATNFLSFHGIEDIIAFMILGLCQWLTSFLPLGKQSTVSPASNIQTLE